MTKEEEIKQAENFAKSHGIKLDQLAEEKKAHKERMKRLQSQLHASLASYKLHSEGV